jgi:hypothetical protein
MIAATNMMQRIFMLSPDGTVTLSEIVCGGHFTSRYYAESTAARHIFSADARKARRVLAEVR